MVTLRLLHSRRAFDPFTSKTEKLGFYSIVSLLRNRLNAYCDASFNDTEVGFALRQGYMTGYKDTAKIVEEVLDIQARRIKELLKEWDLTGMMLIFIGDTSKLLQKQLEKHFGKDIFIPDDANLINSRGFLRQ